MYASDVRVGWAAQHFRISFRGSDAGVGVRHAGFCVIGPDRAITNTAQSSCVGVCVGLRCLAAAHLRANTGHGIIIGKSS